MEPRETILRTLLDAKQMAEHNALCYSANWVLTQPKQGFENEFYAAKQKYNDILRALEYFQLTTNCKGNGGDSK